MSSNTKTSHCSAVRRLVDDQLNARGGHGGGDPGQLRRPPRGSRPSSQLTFAARRLDEEAAAVGQPDPGGEPRGEAAALGHRRDDRGPRAGPAPAGVRMRAGLTTAAGQPTRRPARPVATVVSSSNGQRSAALPPGVYRPGVIRARQARLLGGELDLVPAGGPAREDLGPLLGLGWRRSGRSPGPGRCAARPGRRSRRTTGATGRSRRRRPAWPPASRPRRSGSPPSSMPRCWAQATPAITGFGLGQGAQGLRAVRSGSG